MSEEGVCAQELPYLGCLRPLGFSSRDWERGGATSL